MADQTFNVSCGFFNAVNNDRTYSAEDMTRPYSRVVSNGVFATNAGTPSTDLQVVSAGDGMKIKVKSGEGIFANKWFNSSDISITVPSNVELVPRRDSVIVQVNTLQSGRSGNIVYRTGTPSSSPVPPNIGTVTGIIEYRIANIYVASGATSIGNDAIVDLRGSSECPWVTGLITQVDTSTLYNQWNTAYQNFYTQELARVEEFMRTLTQDLTVSMDVTTFQSAYNSSGGESQVEINISGYDKRTDLLQVFINGMKAPEGSRYTISSNSQYITLTPSLTSGQRIDFLAFKAIASADNATALALMQQINDDLSALETTVGTLTSDGGWINFTLEGGATAYDDSVKPAVRKYGNRTNIRGAIKGVTAAGTVVCTLPAAYKPAMDHVYTTCAVSSGNITSTVTMQVLASTGQVKLLATAGTIGATDMVSIATNFIVG